MVETVEEFFENLSSERKKEPIPKYLEDLYQIILKNNKNNTSRKIRDEKYRRNNTNDI